MHQFNAGKRLTAVIAATAGIMALIICVYWLALLARDNTHRLETAFGALEGPPRFSFAKECTDHFGEVTYQDGVRGVLPTIQWLGTEKQHSKCTLAMLAHPTVEYDVGEIRDLRIVLSSGTTQDPASVEDLNLPASCTSHYVNSTQSHETDSVLAFRWAGTDEDWDDCFQGVEPWHDYLEEPAIEYQGVKMHDFYIRP